MNFVAKFFFVSLFLPSTHTHFSSSSLYLAFFFVSLQFNFISLDSLLRNYNQIINGLKVVSHPIGFFDIMTEQIAIEDRRPPSYLGFRCCVRIESPRIRQWNAVHGLDRKTKVIQRSLKQCIKFFKKIVNYDTEFTRTDSSH